MAGSDPVRKAREKRMIDAMLATAILMVLGALLLLVIFSLPWWVTVLAISSVILLLDKLLNPTSDIGDGEPDK